MRTTDVAVVGAGPAGIGAALAAVRLGASVVLIDEHDAPGGHLRWTMARQTGFGEPRDGLRGVEIATWAAGALAETGVEVLTKTVAWGLFEGNVLGVASDVASFQLQASNIILATGATDIALPFPGWELPGVMTATAASRLMHLDRVLPGRRVAVLGAGPGADQVASDLDECGADVVRRLTTVESAAAGGTDAVEWLEADEQRFACDAIVLALGRQPDPQLAFQAQAAIEYSTRDGAFVPSRGATFESSLPHVYVVGDAAGTGSPARSFAEGTVAGEAASGGSGVDDAVERLRLIEPDLASPPSFPSIADSTLVCRCEEISASVIRRAMSEGAVNLNDLKRRTRTGMGICQGVYCTRTVAGMLAAGAGLAIELIVPMTARPPARLISMAALADHET